MWIGVLFHLFVGFNKKTVLKYILYAKSGINSIHVFIKQLDFLAEN